MLQATPTHEPAASGIKWYQVFSSWMLPVLAVFVWCEYLLFSWTNGPEGITSSKFYAWIGIFFAGAFLLMRCLWVLGKPKWRDHILGFLIAIVLWALLTSACSTPREVARRLQCANNLKQLGIALHNYHDKFGCLPPAFVADESGKPMHSWRTLLLPFLEDEELEELYQNYDFKKSWNSPENQKLATESQPYMMRCPSSPHLASQTNYVAVLGNDTLWPTDGSSRSFSEVKAGTSNTALLIGIYHPNIPWHEPRDVKLDDFLSGKLSWSGTEVHTLWYTTYFCRDFLYEPWRAGRNILFADGSVYYTRGDLTTDQIRRLFSITEPFDQDDLDNTTLVEPRPIVFRHVVFYIWLATLFIQLIYAYFPTGTNMNLLQRDPEAIASMQAILQIKNSE